MKTNKTPPKALLIGNRPEDYFLGVNSSIVCEVRNSTGNWSPFYSRDERQSLSNGDTYGCTNFSGTNQWEIEANWMLVNNLWPEDALKFWNKHKYIVDGKFEISDRFHYILTGTKIGFGNYMYKNHDSIRKDGVLPEWMLPSKPDMKVEEFITGITEEMKLVAKESLKYFNWMYEFLGDLSPKGLEKALLHAPLQIGIGICAGYFDGNAQVCDADPAHAVVMGNEDDIKLSYDIFDHYEPFKKILAPGYKIYSAVKGVLYPIKRDEPVVQGQFQKDIIFGEQSDEVLKLRKVLNEHGWKNNTANNTYDNELAKAVFKFQLANLSRTFLETIFSLMGRRCGPATRAVLNDYTLGNIMKNNKIWLSSANPQKLALTVKGLLLGVVPLVLIALKAYGITDLGEGDVNVFVDNIVGAVTAIVGAVAAVQVVYGSLRKAYYWFQNR